MVVGPAASFRFLAAEPPAGLPPPGCVLRGHVCRLVLLLVLVPVPELLLLLLLLLLEPPSVAMVKFMIARDLRGEDRNPAGGIRRRRWGVPGGSSGVCGGVFCPGEGGENEGGGVSGRGRASGESSVEGCDRIGEMGSGSGSSQNRFRRTLLERCVRSS